MLIESFKRFWNQDFMEAVVAGCALVSAADGNIDASEKQRMIALMQRIEELKYFDSTEIAASFSNCVKILNFDLAIGKEELFKYIRKIKDNPDVTKTLVRICYSIGEADGNFDDDEKNMLKEICHQLNLNPSDFDL